MDMKQRRIAIYNKHLFSCFTLLSPSFSVGQPHPSFLGPSLDACWEPRPAPLSTQSQVHSGSFLLALYQHRLHRCRCRFVCFLVDMRACLCVCMSARHGGRSYFFWVLDWARADCVSVPASMWICEYVCICVLAKCGCVWEREQRDHIPSLSQGTQGAYNFKGPWGPATPACPPRGKSCWCGGACLGKTSS